MTIRAHSLFLISGCVLQHKISLVIHPVHFRFLHSDDWKSSLAAFAFACLNVFNHLFSIQHFPTIFPTFVPHISSTFGRCFGEIVSSRLVSFAKGKRIAANCSQSILPSSRLINMTLATG